MPFFINRNFENQLFEYIQSMQSWNNARPVNLGGVSGPGGGNGGPPGGFFGQLPQSRISYDTSEISASGLPVSGWSILDNLNHIRYKLDNLGGITVLLNLLDADGETIHNLTFSGGLLVAYT
jgi:hypothetical protein